MFEFFIALFGGAYYLCRYCDEKAKTKAYNTKHEKWLSLQSDIKIRYQADEKLSRWAKELILSGENYDEICEWFAEDFEYALGTDWKSKLDIPKHYPWSFTVIDFPTDIPCNITWVYHLILAKYGKIDDWVIYGGFKVGDTDEAVRIHTRFAECIEWHLINAGVHGVRFALELSPRVSPDKIRGGQIKIESLCNYPTYRLWD